MKNLERLKQMSIEDLTELFCNTMQTINENSHSPLLFCETCPFTNKCSIGHNGFKAWAEEEE